MGAFVWVVNIVTPEKVCVDGAIVKIQSMPDSTCSVCINVYVILRLFFSYYWRLAKLHTIPCAMMALATFMKPAMLAPFT